VALDTGARTLGEEELLERLRSEFAAEEIEEIEETEE
jgi:hypothetical protein